MLYNLNQLNQVEENGQPTILFGDINFDIRSLEGDTNANYVLHNNRLTSYSKDSLLLRISLFPKNVGNRTAFDLTYNVYLCNGDLDSVLFYDEDNLKFHLKKEEAFRAVIRGTIKKPIDEMEDMTLLLQYNYTDKIRGNIHDYAIFIIYYDDDREGITGVRMDYKAITQMGSKEGVNVPDSIHKMITRIKKKK